ncbi:uncharacterized protein LOC123498727 isoform X2 [Portunus trituberculatus]|uniref:uncharacterized protein LOC123498727 isoform X2 n=1 Tax=Portunus trituberculatus TaxID=210409 RepID=UPI001E1CCCE8|nr:uncharacterized protein LOC123498727 isoform X2 [Portunus trituberculatus]
MNTAPGCRAPLSPPGARTVWLWVWLWALVLTHLGALADCPKVCECKWRDGKEVVTCRDAHFIDIPRGLDPSTQVLDLRHNNLKILPRDSFVYTGLVNLQKVWLNFCNLIKLEEGAFRMLNNVVELDLSNNYLQGVPSDALADLPGLRVLRMAHNGLTVLPASAFLPVPDLVQLDLSHNTISEIESGALRSLASLGVLNLSGNKLASLDVDELKALMSLRVAHMDGNPWRCDCHLRPLSKWMQARNLAATIPPVCSFPRWLSGNNWQLLDEDEFVCAPVVTAVAPRVLAAEGENVSLACRVESEVETTITWLVGEAPLQNATEAQRYMVVEVFGPQNPVYVSNLTISDVAPFDQGTYRCLAENRAGRGEVNLTLQVSHEVAEVRVATVDDSYYMKGGVVGGISIFAVVLLASCLLIYCKVRSTRRPRQEDDKLVTPQTSRGSDGGEHHTLTGYQVVPTSDMEEQSSSRRSQQIQPPWMLREASAPGKALEAGGAEGRRQESVDVPVTHPIAAPSTVSYVEIPKSGVGTVRTTLEDPTRWKDPLVYHSRDVLLHRLCGRSASQAATASTNGGHYPDLLDLPPQQQFQQQQEMQQHATYLPLHTPSPSYCTLPRTRTRVQGDASTRVEEEEAATAAANAAAPAATVTGKAGHHLHHQHHHLQYQPQLPPPLPHHLHETASYSALNLALSEAACHAYAHIPPHALPQCPPATHTTGHHPHARQDLILAHRSHCAAASGEVGCTPDPYRFEYHAAQLEKFLREYRCLQEQLIHMKQSYEAQQLRGSAPRLDCCSESTGTGAAPQGITVTQHGTVPQPHPAASPPLGTSHSPHASTPQSNVTASPPHAAASPPLSVSLPPCSTPLSYVTAPSPHVTAPLYIITSPPIITAPPPSLEDLPPPLDVIPPPCELLPPPCEILPPPVTSSVSRTSKSSPPSRPTITSTSPPTSSSSSLSSSSSSRGPSKSSKSHTSGHHSFSDSPGPAAGRHPLSGASAAEPLKSILKKPSETAKHHHQQQQQQQQQKHKQNPSASTAAPARQ